MCEPTTATPPYLFSYYSPGGFPVCKLATGPSPLQVTTVTDLVKDLTITPKLVWVTSGPLGGWCGERCGMNNGGDEGWWLLVKVLVIV